MLSTLLVGLALLPKPFDFYRFAPYDSAIPKPETVLGYTAGDKITTFRDQERTLYAIAGAAPRRVKVTEFGRSVEGRPLKVLAISSAANIDRLDEIKQEHLAIARGGGAPLKTPDIVWVNECIHGNEPASFESAMWLTYNLVASKNSSITEALRNTVVIVNPVYNPDGHERFAVYYDSIATGSSDPRAYETREPSAIYGRLNHYRFDMNRDRVSFSQDETKQEIAEFLRWNPQVYIDQHGQVGSYFMPPNPMSINPNVDRERLNHWTDLFGRSAARAFDQIGFSYYVKDEFDLYYPGYLDSDSTLMGAIGMTHETDGGKELAKQREDGSVVTLRQGIAKHFTSALAVIQAASANHDTLMASYAKFKSDAVTGKSAGKFQRVVLVSPDSRPLRRLQDQLSRGGVTSSFNRNPFTQSDANDYWTGKRGTVVFPPLSLIVDIAQPQGPVAKALLEPQSGFEPEFAKAQQAKKKTAPEGEQYPGPDGAEFYDLTGWALPYGHQLQAYWCESAPRIAETELPRVARASEPSGIGYVLPYTDEDDALAAFDLLSAGVRVSQLSEAMSVGGRHFDRGSFIVMLERNDVPLQPIMASISAKRHVSLAPLTTEYPDQDRTGPGSGSVRILKAPKVAVVFGNSGEIGSVGGPWFLLEQEFKVPFTPVTINALGGQISDFTCIIVPSGSRIVVTPKLREWVNGGGSLIVLDQASWAIPSLVELQKAKGEPQDLPGSLFRAELDQRSFLSYGYPTPVTGKIEVAVPIGGSRFYASRKEGGSVVSLSADEKLTKLLSGWEYDDDTEKALAGTVWLQDTPIGRGHVVLFTQDPTDRAMWPGFHKMLLNAILIGR